MKVRNKIFAFLLCLLLTAGLFAGCTTEIAQLLESTDGDLHTVEKEDSTQRGPLRDKDTLYEDSDPTEVLTMYLTVRTGNTAENTDHTWKEINSYSVYDYDAKGEDRYRVEAILQMGDENGPLADAFGYGAVTPNAIVQIRGQTSSLNPQKN